MVWAWILVVTHRHDLFACAGRDQPEAFAAGAAHAQGVPADQSFERIILPEEGHQNLVGAGAVVAPPPRRE